MPNMCLEIYMLDSAHFLFASELPWQVAIKKDRVKLDLLTDVGMLSIRPGQIYFMAPDFSAYKNQSVRPIYKQLEALLFVVLHSLNRTSCLHF